MSALTGTKRRSPRGAVNGEVAIDQIAQSLIARCGIVRVEFDGEFGQPDSLAYEAALDRVLGRNGNRRLADNTVFALITVYGHVSLDAVHGNADWRAEASLPASELLRRMAASAIVYRMWRLFHA